MIRVKRSAAAIVAAAAGVALVAACGSSGGSSKPTVGNAPTQKTNNAVNQINAQPRSALKSGGSMTWVLSETIPNFNYYNVNGTLDDTNNLLSSLEPTPFHFSADGTPSVDTDYFTSITQTKSNPLTIDYKINPKAKWSDGTSLSYMDLYGAWQSQNGKNAKYAISASQGYNQIASVKEGANAQEAIVTYATPFTDWRSLFAPLLPYSLTKTPDAFNNSWVNKPLVTAGPFKWGSSNKTQQSYTVVKDPNWWGDPALLNSITFAAYSDTSSAVQALGQHEVDYVDLSGSDAVSNIAAAKKYTGVRIDEAAGNNYRQITFNTKDPLLSDLKVRQAIVLGINRQAITTALIGKLGGNPTPLQNHFFMKNQSAYKATCGDYCSYDPTKAKQLLESDGWTMKNGYFEKNGKQLSVSITIPSQTTNAQTESEIAQATLKAAGIKLTIESVPSNDFFPKYVFSGSPSSSGKFQLTVFTWIGTPFPVGGALSIFKYDPQSKGQNAGFGGTTAINTLLSNASSAATTDEENTLANEASTQMWNNASWLPLYQRPQIAGVTSDLANVGARGFADTIYQNIGFEK